MNQINPIDKINQILRQEIWLGSIGSQEDVRSLLTIFSEVWGAETLSELVTSLKDTECLLIKNNGAVVGYIFYGWDGREDFYEITDLGVLESQRGKGFGCMLVSAVCAKSNKTKTNKVRLCVKADNPAKFVYEKLGFCCTQTIQNYYGVNQDGLRMEWAMRQ